MTQPTIIVVGGSAGALEPLVSMLRHLPGSFPAAVLVAMHSSPQSPGMLPKILERAGSLPALFPQDGQPVQPGQVFVAPPDFHLTLVDGRMSVAHGPRENGFRPAIDPLFRSAAVSYASRAVGVVLSGALDDGAYGLLAIKRAGGIAVVQHPEDAFVSSMPLSAIRQVEVDHIVTAAALGPLLIRITQDGRSAPREPAKSRVEREGAAMDPKRDIGLSSQKPDTIPGAPSAFVCPECGGALWEHEEAGMPRFRCHTGHGFTAETLLAQQNGELERALWSAVRVLRERAAMHRQIAERMRKHGSVSTADKYEERSHEEDSKAAVIRSLLQSSMPEAPQNP